MDLTFDEIEAEVKKALAAATEAMRPAESRLNNVTARLQALHDRMGRRHA